MAREPITDPGVISRFMSFVELGDNPNECWRWTGAINFAKGYGSFRLSGEGPRPAHEVSYRIFVGSIPDGHEMRHTQPCKCVNPFHLTTGSKAQNIQDKVDQGTVAKGTRCRSNILTEDQVRYIRASIKSTKELAAELGVHYCLTCWYLRSSFPVPRRLLKYLEK